MSLKQRADDLSKNTHDSSAADEDEQPRPLLHTQRPHPHVDIYENTVMQKRGLGKYIPLWRFKKKKISLVCAGVDTLNRRSGSVITSACQHDPAASAFCAMEVK